MIVYIKENEEINLLYKIFNIFKLDNMDNKSIIYLPINQNTRKKKIEQNAKKLERYLYNNNIKDVVLSEKLMKIEELKNILYSNNINILDGTKLSKFLTYDIVKKIYKYKNMKMEAGEISILVNDNNTINIENIMQLAQDTKRLNILTNNIKKFKKVSDYLYNELGILIKLSNNIKMNLSSSNIIINIDFPEEVVNQLQIPSNATIIGIPNSINIYSKKFAGVNIKKWEIEIPDEYKIIGFADYIVYESTIYNKQPNMVLKQIKKDNIKIKKLLGINGIINKREFA